MVLKCKTNYLPPVNQIQKAVTYLESVRIKFLFSLSFIILVLKRDLSRKVKVMDWCYDFAMLFVTFCAIAVGMTIYVRINSKHSRYNKYVYTGIIPTITITTCEDMPNAVSAPSSEQQKENETNVQENSNTSTNQENVNNSNLTVPILDDDFDDEEEVVEIETVPLVESTTEEEKQNVIVTLPEDEEIKQIKNEELDNEELSNKELSNEELNKEELSYEELSNEEFINENYDYDFENIEAEIILDENNGKLIDEGNLIEIIKQTQTVDESPPKTICDIVNGITWKYGTSHTVEDPLFPFSETVLEDEKLSVKNRSRKRLSQ